MSKRAPLAFLKIRAHPGVNVIIIILALPLGGFLLLIGVTELLYPDVSAKYLFMNAVMCLLVCAIGLSLLLLAGAAFRGLLHNKKDSKEKGQT